MTTTLPPSGTTTALPMSGTPATVGFDPNELLARYAQEREVRLNRPEATGVPPMAEENEELRLHDPYMPRIERPALDETYDVLIFGGGFGGISAAKALKESGIESFKIVEQAGEFGGTWYWNRYPGVQCDVQSYLYLPYLEETGYMPTKKYVDGDEIFEHAKRLARHFDLYPHALFQTLVTESRWDDVERVWVVTTDRGDVLKAKFVLRANGPFSKPLYPRVAGLHDFKGKLIHTSRWDYDYTGGGPGKPLDNLQDKRVALVGTGATGLQVAPHLAEAAKELYVIQRTPPVVAERNNGPTDPEWAASLTPGWQARMHSNFVDQLSGFPDIKDQVQDVWTKIYRELPGRHLVDDGVDVSALPVPDQQFLSILADLTLGEEVRTRVETIIEDPETAEALKPWYGIVCKRPGFHDGYLPIFNRDSVHLVNAPHGLDRLTERGLVAGGQEIEVDVIVFATGFEAGPNTLGNYGYEILGRDGLSMREHFVDGLKTLHGFTSRDFPNFIEMGLSQNTYNVHYTYMIDRKARHATRLIKHVLDNGHTSVEPTRQAQQEWIAEIRRAGAVNHLYQTNCTPGYYNGQGAPEQGIFREIYQAPDRVFWNLIEDWWQTQDFDGIEFDRAGPADTNGEDPTMPTSELKTPLAPDSQAVADLVSAAVPGGINTLGVEGLRAFSAQLDAQVPDGAPVDHVHEVTLGEGDSSFRLRVYRPESSTPLPVLLYVHGGGWTMGGIDGGYDYLCRDLVSKLGIAVVSVDYRLAPEHKFPAAVEDVVSSLAWLRASAQELGFDPTRIAVGGDSAGGNLSAVLTHLDREAQVPIKAQVLFYPGTEYAVERPSWIENKDAALLNVADVLWFFDQYLESTEVSNDPRVSPSLNESFAGLPSAIVVTAGHDPLRDDGINYADLLERDGVEVRRVHIPDTIHGFVTSPALGAYDTGVGEVIDFLTKKL